MIEYAVSTNPGGLHDCYFYHSSDLPKSGEIQGSWDLRGRFDEYLGNIDFAGKRALDVGCASGFLTFEMEKRGAEVVSVDASSIDQINFLPFKSFWDNFEHWKQAGGETLRQMKNSYWLSHQELGSRAKAYYGDIYRMPKSLGTFDVVVIAQILVHLRDPIEALRSAADRSSDTLIIAEGMIDDEGNRSMRFLGSANGSPAATWWHLTTGLYREVLTMMEFDIVSKHTAPYRCNDANQDIPITTLVAKRKSNS
jgi:2-polyprenyl-3-methyl-5-hydroxy-6-metoxy-1,4-benzoquinol methylase